MSIETRSSSALFKRAEQLKRWAQSDTNREPVSPKTKNRKIKFSSGCVFLAACASGDKEEVLRLLQKGADINTANVDGLTALHQACIDDNLEMVEFLVEHGADVNRGDNEGWTPLHATASCGFQSIAHYLLERGADVAAVNNDGELPLDIAEERAMEELIRREVDERGVDCELARSEEERTMLADARDWLAASAASATIDRAHPKTGATALHVAAAKGYVKVMAVLVQCRADLDRQDLDGWTPLHAAAYWGQREAAAILADNLADMDVCNYVGQTPFDVAADSDMIRHLDELKKRQNKEEVLSRKQAKKRTDATGGQTRTGLEDETPPKLKRVEVEIQPQTQQQQPLPHQHHDTVEKKNRANSLTDAQRNQTKEQNSVKATPPAPTTPPKQMNDAANVDENSPSWRRPASFRSKTVANDKNLTLRITDNKDKTSPTSSPVEPLETEVTLRRTQSFQSDPKVPAKESPTEGVEPESAMVNSSTAVSGGGAANPQVAKPAIVTSPATSPLPNVQVRSDNIVTPPSVTIQKILQIMVENQRSFVPPVRDEESETQRKKHAKRVRETRRSTQGVTLDEIKSAAEQLNSKQQNQTQPATNNNNNNEQCGANGDTANVTANITATITTGTGTVPTLREGSAPDEGPTSHERRPSWRLRVDNGTSKFKLEEVSASETNPSTVYVRRPAAGGVSGPRPSSAPVTTTSAATETPAVVPPATTADATVTIAIRRPKSLDDRDQDKENDARNAQATLATQAAIQRRRRPKRRSTGVVHVDMDEIDPDKQDPSAGGDYEDNTKVNHQDSGSESRSGSRSSRLGPASELATLRGENGELDYKKMYEQATADNDRLKDKLRKSEEELRDTKTTLEKLQTVTSKNSLSELEKRERRAMERKLSEMEEELKQLEALKTENQRLKDENGALIRVISKLSK